MPDRVRERPRTRPAGARAGGRTPRQQALFADLVTLLLAEGFAHLTLDDLAGRLRCSKRTLYDLAGSKEQLVAAAVVEFFRAATARVAAAVPADAGAADRLRAYLRAVSRELAAASDAFFEDVAAFPPAAQVYARNTRAAAERVRGLVEAGVRSGEFADLDVGFVADVVAATTVRIHAREVAAATGLDDAAAYERLADLLLRALRP